MLSSTRQLRVLSSERGLGLRIGLRCHVNVSVRNIYRRRRNGRMSRVRIGDADHGV